MDSITKCSSGEIHVPAKRVNSLADYVKLVEEIAQEWRAKTKERFKKGKRPVRDFPGEMVPWFRGTTDARYALEPSLLRDHPVISIYNTDRNQIKLAEQYMRLRFKGGERLRYSTTRVEKERDWVFLMQHHGLPTRLLDWSKNSLTALYFAIRKYRQKIPPQDAAVWIMDPRRLSEACQLGRSIIFPRDEKKKNDRLDKYYSLSASLREPSYPIPVIPPILTDRLAAQQSRFTYHTDKPGGLENFATDIARQDRCWYLVKLIIPRDRQENILRSLRLVGVTLPDIIPGLDSLASEILERMALGISDLEP